MQEGSEAPGGEGSREASRHGQLRLQRGVGVHQPSEVEKGIQGRHGMCKGPEMQNSGAQELQGDQHSVQEEMAQVWLRAGQGQLPEGPGRHAGEFSPYSRTVRSCRRPSDKDKV